MPILGSTGAGRSFLSLGGRINVWRYLLANGGESGVTNQSANRGGRGGNILQTSLQPFLSNTTTTVVVANLYGFAGSSPPPAASLSSFNGAILAHHGSIAGAGLGGLATAVGGGGGGATGHGGSAFYTNQNTSYEQGGGGLGGAGLVSDISGASVGYGGGGGGGAYRTTMGISTINHMAGVGSAWSSGPGSGGTSAFAYITSSGTSHFSFTAGQPGTFILAANLAAPILVFRNAGGTIIVPTTTISPQNTRVYTLSVGTWTITWPTL